jgi:hypothetical protein
MGIAEVSKACTKNDNFRELCVNCNNGHTCGVSEASTIGATHLYLLRPAGFGGGLEFVKCPRFARLFRWSSDESSQSLSRSLFLLLRCSSSLSLSRSLLRRRRSHSSSLRLTILSRSLSLLSLRFARRKRLSSRRRARSSLRRFFSARCSRDN